MKRTYTLPLFCALLLTTSFSSAQNQLVKEWDYRYGGDYEEGLRDMIYCKNGGFALAGRSGSPPGCTKTAAVQGNNDFWMVVIDSLGNQLFDKSYGGTDKEDCEEIIQCPDGGYALAGRTQSPIGGDVTQPPRGEYDYWVVRTDSNGLLLWERRFGGDENDYGYDICFTDDGGFVVAGDCNSDSTGDKTEPSRGLTDYWMVKMDASGNKVWDKRFGGSGWDNCRSVIQTSDKGFMLAGWTQTIGADGDVSSAGCYIDYWIVKTDSLGNLQWDKRIGGPNSDYGSSIEQTTDGGYIIGGYSYSGNGCDKSQNNWGEDDYWIVKTDAAGNVE